jgi:ribosomal protein L19
MSTTNIKLLNNNFNINNIEYFILYKHTKKYLKTYKYFYYAQIRTGNIVFVELLNYEFFSMRKYFFLGLCIGMLKKKSSSSFILRNVIGNILVEQQFLMFNKLIIFIRVSKKRVIPIGLKKSKLFFLINLPFFFRLNKFALLETFYYSNKKKVGKKTRRQIKSKLRRKNKQKISKN